MPTEPPFQLAAGAGAGTHTGGAAADWRILQSCARMNAWYAYSNIGLLSLFPPPLLSQKAEAAKPALQDPPVQEFSMKSLFLAGVKVLRDCMCMQIPRFRPLVFYCYTTSNSQEYYRKKPSRPAF